MALLIDIGVPEWMRDEALRDELAPLLPGVTIHCGRPAGVLPDVRMLATATLARGVLARLPGLELVQKLGAGVETILRDPELAAGIRVARLASDVQAREIAEYCLAYVLREQRHLDRHAAAAAEGRWEPLAPRRADETTVGVLGLGHVGGCTARLFASLGFRTIGWSRSPRAIEGVDCRAGDRALASVLGACDHVVAVLPATPRTRGLLDARRLAQMKAGATLINVGRGDLLDETALIEALERGTPGAAVLDTLPAEPLPPGHPFWRHPRITVTPHVSGWHLDGGFADVAENYRRLVDGRSLLHEVDRSAGY